MYPSGLKVGHHIVTATGAGRKPAELSFDVVP